MLPFSFLFFLFFPFSGLLFGFSFSAEREESFPQKAESHEESFPSFVMVVLFVVMMLFVLVVLFVIVVLLISPLSSIAALLFPPKLSFLSSSW